MTKAKTGRSIIYDEIGHRLGRGRKPGRREVSTPEGVSHETKRLSIEHAKMLIIHRHWDEVLTVFSHEVLFMKALDEWYLGRHPKGYNEAAFEQFGLVVKPSEAGTVAFAEACAEFYAANDLTRPGTNGTTGTAYQRDERTLRETGNVDGAEEVPFLAEDGRELLPSGRPRPRKRSEVS